MDDQMTKAMADAIQQATSKSYPGDLVTRWVAMVETVDPEGDRSLIVASQEGLKSWDVLGMLQFGLQVEQAATMIARLED